MDTIWKFNFEINHTVEIQMPFGAEILHVDDQYGMPTLWAQVDPTAQTSTIKLVVRGTGQPFQGNEGKHIGTFQQFEGAGVLVWHVFRALE